MLLYPKKVKFQKQHSRKDGIKSFNNFRTFGFGHFALYAKDPGKINAKQIQTINFFLRKASQRQAKFWLYMPVFRSVSKKPNEVRLGRGKGSVKYWCFITKPGTLILEVKSRNSTFLKNLLSELQSKLNIKTILCNKFSRWVL